MLEEKDKAKAADEPLNLVIEQKQTVELRQPKKKGMRGKVVYRKEKKTTWHLHGLMGIKNPQKLAETIDKILKGEYKLIK